METKQSIRSRMKALRGALGEAEAASRSRAITDKILQSREYQACSALLVYADYNHEVITCYTVEKAWSDRKAVYMPRCRGKEMDFIRVRSFEELSPGFRSVPEPCGTEIFDKETGLVLMPGLAFGRNFGRIGYGGGFYDRYLAQRPGLIRMGIGFSFQILPEVPIDPTDICPQIIVSEKEVIHE